MQKAQIVARFLVPADQDASETIHPTMRAFHHPAPRFETGLLLEGLGFFPACPDVGSEAKLLQEVSNFVIVIAFIQAQSCLLYTSDAADERSSVDLGGRRIIK